MKKNCVALILLFALLTCLFQTPTLAATDIPSVSLSVEVPIQGALPAKPEINTNGVSLYAYEWLDGENKLSSFDSFEGGKTYTLKVRVTTLQRFPNSVSVKINNQSASILGIEYNNTHILFKKEFYVSPMGYTLSFDPGIGSGTMAPLTGKTAYTLPPCSFTPPAGKEFSCWRVGDTNDLYQEGETILLQENTTVRAVWVTPSGKTKIQTVEATSNIGSIAVLYGPIKAPAITVKQGAPAYVLTGAGNLKWQKKVNGTWTDQSNVRFSPGEWRITTQIRIDGESAAQYELGTPVTLTVDGAAWTMSNNGVPSVHHDYSMIPVTSPTFTIADDPNVKPPVDITKVNLTVSGYKLGAKTQNATATADHEGVIVAGVQFVEAKDSNDDGFPDETLAAETFEAGKIYFISFKLKAKSGYNVSTLGFTSVTCNKAEVIGSYNTEEDCYNGMGQLIPFDLCTVSFAPGGGTGTMAGVTVEKGDYTLPQNGFTAPSGKRFKAWSVGGKEVSPNGKITVTANTTVTALWEPIPADHVCKQEPVPKVDPTCTENGKEAYFRCEGCGRFYEDAAGTKEITDLFSWGNLEKLGHTDADRDDKCDACGFVLSLPSDTIPLPVPPSTTDDADNSDTTDTPTASKTASEPSKAKNEKEPSLGWIWIIIAVLFVAAGTTVTILILRKKKHQKT